MKKINLLNINLRLGKHPISLLNLSFLLVSFLFLFNNCQEKTEGCLDIRATNFDVTSGKACKDCCTFPYLQLQVQHLVDTNILKLPYKFKIGNDSIELIQVQFYTSNFKIFKSTNEVATVFDSILLFRQTDTLRVPNNFALISKGNGFDYRIGQFNSVGTYSKLNFKMGLDDIANKTIPLKMPASSPLSIRQDTMYIDNQKKYIFNKIVFARGTNLKDTVSLYITQAKDIEINNIKNLTFKDGFDAVIPLKINYLRFFDDVKITEQNNIIMDKIVNNYSKVFSVN
jgi:hypothetical protein